MQDLPYTSVEHESRRLSRRIAFVILLWISLFVALYSWQSSHLQNDTVDMAALEAITHFNKDQALRFWATSHGGVYVPTDEDTPPSPWLSHIPERDITTPSGRELTLMNPAYILRQVSEEHARLFGEKGHITSLKPLNPANGPDTWERAALEAFEEGAKEVTEMTEIDGKPYFRFMRPMITRQGCLKCHKKQGYRVGDIRGGVSITVDMAPYLEHQQEGEQNQRFVLFTICVLGLTGLLIGWYRGLSQIREQKQSQQVLQESEDRLHTITDAAQDAVVAIDDQGAIRYWNRAAERIFGYSREEAMGMNLHRLIVPERYHQAHIDGWHHFAESGEGAVIGKTLELSALDREGIEFPVEFSISSIKIQGKWQAVSVIRDIRERKKSEEKIGEINQKIAQANREWMDAFDSIQDPIFLHDDSGAVMRANLAYARRADMAIEELIGRPYWECFPKVDGPMQSCLLAKESHNTEEINEEITMENGDILLSRAFAIHDDEGSYRYSIHIMEDITFEKRAKQTLRESENRFRDLFESAPLPYLSLDSEGHIIEVNNAWEVLFEYKREQVIGHPFEEYLSTASREKYLKDRHICAVLQDDKITEIEVCRGDGSERIIATQCRLSYELGGKQTVNHCILTDITERKRAEASLLIKDQVFESSLSAISTSDINGVLTNINPAFLKIWGYENPEEVLGKPIPDFLVSEDETKEIIGALNSEGKWEGSYTALRKDGSTFIAYGLATALKDIVGNITGYQSSALDITKQKQAEEVLNEERNRAQSYLDIAPVIMVVINSQGEINLINRQGCEVLGYGEQELIGKNWIQNCVPQHMQAQLQLFFEQLMQGELEPVEHYENPIISRSGEERLIAWNNSIIRDSSGEISGLLSSGEDITDRKASEISLHNLNQMLRTSQACNEALVRATEESALIQQICDILADHADFSLVWVGLSEQEAKSGTSVYSSDHCESIELFNNNWHDEEGPCPAKEAIRTGKIQTIHATDDDPTFQRYRDKVAAIGCFSLAALPLQNKGMSLGVMMVYSYKGDVFNKQQIDLLEELANDLAYGINSLRLHQERDQMGEHLERNLLQTVQAIARTLETRDPYTAGHQRRVTELSIAIAREMGLDEQQIEGIRFGATIHDIGKIHIPAEILNRPGQLNEMEFGIIKTHAEVGHEIVKEIDFPWPVADIVYQHHERLDGSGYPQGLKGDEIILEARILAVADVVEAMSSHRPYRPGLGIEAALDEINKNRGKFYDPDITDVCIKLFNEKQFTFSDSF